MVVEVPDRHYSDPRLAAIYDYVDGDRSDLDHYEAIAAELEAKKIIDIGCGTGSLACRLASSGLVVIGVDPAEASLTVARAKPQAASVTWLLGTAADLTPLDADLAVMTGNVAQVFVDDDDWVDTLDGIRRSLKTGGHLVFETRDPAFKAWEGWDVLPTATYDTPVGPVEYTLTVTEVDLPLVSFTADYRFTATGQVLTSESTLRYRDRSEIDQALNAAGFSVTEVRDAPDRPGREFVFIAEAISAGAGKLTRP